MALGHDEEVHSTFLKSTKSTKSTKCTKSYDFMPFEFNATKIDKMLRILLSSFKALYNMKYKSIHRKKNGNN